MRVQPAAFALVILLLCPAAFGAEAVVVQTPSTKYVATLQRLRDACGNEGEFDACTRFVAYRLEAKCASSAGSAMMNASVTFRPMILLHNLRQLPHELLHIEDVRLFAAKYVDAIGQRTFASDGDCAVEAARLAAGFEAKMHEFARRSNLERHPILRAAGH